MRLLLLSFIVTIRWDGYDEIFVLIVAAYQLKSKVAGRL